MLDLKDKDALKNAVKSVFDQVNAELEKLNLPAWDEKRLVLILIVVDNSLARSSR